MSKDMEEKIISQNKLWVVLLEFLKKVSKACCTML